MLRVGQGERQEEGSAEVVSVATMTAEHYGGAEHDNCVSLVGGDAGDCRCWRHVCCTDVPLDAREGGGCFAEKTQAGASP